MKSKMTKKEILEKYNDAESIISLNDITKGSFMYLIAEAKINHQGYYTCMYQGIKTLVFKTA